MEVGDRVEYINRSSYELKKGVVGIVKKIKGETSSYMLVDFGNGDRCWVDKDRLKLIDKKEEKVEKIEVRSWEDLKGYVICKDVDMVVEKQQRRSYGGSIFEVDSLEKCVKILNALGGNFEYKEIEVIDTLEKWEEFQEKICRFSYVYDRVLGVFIEMRSDNDNESFVGIIDGDVAVKKIEEKYNVELKILKED